MRHMKSAVTGTLQEKNGKFYLVLRIPDSTGKLHQKWVSTGLPVQGNQRRAKQLLDAKLVELQADYDRRSRQAGWAVAEVGEVPFDEVVRRMTRKRSEVAPSTFEGYEHITSRLLPYFRKLDLTMNEVSPTALESYCAFLLDAGLSANTVNHHLTLIKSVFNDEIRNGAPILNPVKCVKSPRVETFQGETLSVKQIGQLFRLFEGDPIEGIIRIGVIYGLRRSEILGLRWQDIDFETGTLQIRHKVAEVRINGKQAPACPQQRPQDRGEPPRIPTVGRYPSASGTPQGSNRGKPSKKAPIPDRRRRLCVRRCEWQAALARVCFRPFSLADCAQ